MSRGGEGGRTSGAGANPASAEEITSQRLDKWLWFARLAKTRTQAAALVAGGRIRINRERVDKPGFVVKAGDVVTATVHRAVCVLRITGFIARRGPAAEACALYEELTPAADRTKSLVHGAPVDADERPAGPQHAGRRPGAGRPTKRERRDIDRLKDPSL